MENEKKKPRFLVQICSEDYYREFDDPIVLALPDDCDTIEKCNEYIKIMTRKMHLVKYFGNTYTSIDHYRVERGHYDGLATYRIEVIEEDFDSFDDEFVEKFLELHPNNIDEASEQGFDQHKNALLEYNKE